jgi:hypothetical protein
VGIRALLNVEQRHRFGDACQRVVSLESACRVDDASHRARRAPTQTALHQTTGLPLASPVTGLRKVSRVRTNSRIEACKRSATEQGFVQLDES